MLLLLTLRASGQTAAVELQVYDRAGLSPLAVQSFAKQTQEIFSEAGVSIRIYICARGQACEIHGTPAKILVLRIVPGSSRQI